MTIQASQIGNFIITNKIIGKGAFSTVVKGFNIETNKPVAIKIINVALLKPALAKKLPEELTLIKSLKHDYIVYFYDYYTDPSYYYIVLEYCNGGDLYNLLRTRGALHEDLARSVMSQLVQALEYLKSRNIIHRDLKPQNILIHYTDPQETNLIVKLTDFNFAREMADIDLSETMCGTPLYMAPEILMHHKYNSKSDLWSLGLILYEMVYGYSPFMGALSFMDILKLIKEDSIKYDEAKVSADCNTLIRKLLVADPNNRMTWYELFTDPWLDLSEPSLVAPEQDSSVWKSVYSTTEPIAAKTVAAPKPIVIDNYIPFGLTPPKQTQSEQMRERSNTSSTLSGHILSYLTASANMIKGAADYLSTLGGASPP